MQKKGLPSKQSDCQSVYHKGKYFKASIGQYMNHNRSQLCSMNTDTGHGHDTDSLTRKFSKKWGKQRYPLLLCISVCECNVILLCLDIFYYTLIHFKVLVITVLPHLKWSHNCIFTPGGSLKYSERVHKVSDPKYCKKKKRTIRERSVGHLSGACPCPMRVRHRYVASNGESVLHRESYIDM